MFYNKEAFSHDDPIHPICIGCNKRPKDIPEYSPDNIFEIMGKHMTPDEFVRREEGTYNRENGHFLCTECYFKAGMPSSPRGWKAP